jgi:hypothetical protein
MDTDLRNSLWNVCFAGLLSKLDVIGYLVNDDEANGICLVFWGGFFKLPLDDIPREHRKALKVIKNWFTAAEWPGVYDFVQFVADAVVERQNAEEFRQVTNQILEQERSAYRFVGGLLVPISDQQELGSIITSSELPDHFKSARQHIRTAVERLSDRKSPDHRNSIKESISAVEAICQILTGDDKATLGQALKKLEDKGIELHSALKSGFSKLYGYTNEADGIRHALLAESTLDFDDAKFMLVSCSAFVNYLAAKASKAGVVAAGLRL